MNKNKLLNLLRNSAKIKGKLLQELENMAETYPYCQMIHTLVAKGYSNAEPDSFQKKLNHAAIYSANRKALKHYIQDEQGNSTPDSTSRETHSPDEITTEASHAPADSSTISNNAVEEEAPKSSDTEAENLNISPPDPEFEANLTTSEYDENTSGNEEIYKELQENLDALKAYKNKLSDQTKVEEKEITETPGPNLQNKGQFTPLSNNVEKERMEEYLASLKASDELEEKAVEDEKIREQIKIINHFIENEPKLSRLEREDSTTEKREDLSLRSLKVDENIASENLALIMAKQGKIEKAEEIYNKLIWKFPEKRAYFVARIEDLKKK